MGILKKYKNIIIVAVIIVIAAFSYNLFVDKTDDSLLTSEVLQGVDGSTLESDLLSVLIDLRSIKLDDSIFSSQVFMSLKDFGQDIVPEPVGRENPFAPVDSSTLTGSVIEIN